MGTVIGETAVMLVSAAEQGGDVVPAGYRRPDALEYTAASDLQLLVKVQEDTGEGPYRGAASSGE